MAKTYEVVVYDDDGKGVTSAVSEYDRDDNGVQTYVGRAWLDADETATLLAVLRHPGRLGAALAAARRCLGATLNNRREMFIRLCALSDALRACER